MKFESCGQLAATLELVISPSQQHRRKKHRIKLDM
jgi:hypothetical protein